MEEKFLYSSIEPLLTTKGQQTIDDSFREQIKKSNNLQISVGFVSVASLTELDRLITESGVKKVCLVLGMYFFNGFPRSLHELVLKVNKKWEETGIGEIRLIHSFKYHGKLYLFFKDETPFSAILGSANLSFLTSESTHLHQYEIAVLTDIEDTLQRSISHINDLKSPNISENIAILEREHKLFDINHMMDKVLGESSVSKVESHIVKNLQLDPHLSLEIPLCEPIPQDNKKVSTRRKKKSYKSLNVVVQKNQKLLDEFGHIDNKKWFYVITDDGYEFISLVEDYKLKNLLFQRGKRILERWIKGRIGGSSVVDLKNHHLSDQEELDKEITSEMLKEYGGDCLILTKTRNTKKDNKGIERDIWFLSFPKKSV